MITISKEEIDKLNDDGKLYQHYQNKIVNAKKNGIQCLLSYDEYCILVKNANLKSSQLGYNGQNYVLARYNDSGNYTFDNCRFITQYENIKERKLSEKSIETSKQNIKKAHEYQSKLSKEEKANLVLESEKWQEYI